MARPKKLSDAEMIAMVDSFYESHGNPDMLKCSELEEYAVSLGMDIKAYDFRRNKAVRRRIDELRDLSLLSARAEDIAYKSLDVDAFLSRNRTKPMLRNALTELDGVWQKIYSRAVETEKKNENFKSAVKEKNSEHEKLELSVSDLSERVSHLGKTNTSLVQENRYLRKMLKTYLYSAIADEILCRENVFDECETNVVPETMERMADDEIPSSFLSSVVEDMGMQSGEDYLLNRMRKQIGGDNDA